MHIQWVPLAGFVFATTFTPGPNNIAAMSVGTAHGYGGSLRFLAGISVGFFVVMCACATIAAFVIESLPSVESYLRVVGSLYICWLAVHTLLGSLGTTERATQTIGFVEGFLLQLLNPKVIVYGLTLYSTFLAPLAGYAGYVAASAMASAGVGFVAVTSWALAGTVFSRLLMRRRVKRSVSIVLSCMLVYSALECSGLIEWVRPR